MSTTWAGATSSLPSRNSNTSRTDERLVQLIWTERQMTKIARYDDNPAKDVVKENFLPLDTEIQNCTIAHTFRVLM